MALAFIVSSNPNMILVSLLNNICIYTIIRIEIILKFGASFFHFDTSLSLLLLGMFLGDTTVVATAAAHQDYSNHSRLLP
jgi:hypothetical protein